MEKKLYWLINSGYRKLGASAVTIHGRSCQQRYSKLADLDYIYQMCRDICKFLEMGIFLSCVEWNKHKPDCPELSSCLIARSALIKVRSLELQLVDFNILSNCYWIMSSFVAWVIFTVFCNLGYLQKSNNRGPETSVLESGWNILKDYENSSLEHWGSDTKGILAKQVILYRRMIE